jgi:uncharacterized protein involved in exopolysaccharide biosynthesis
MALTTSQTSTGDGPAFDVEPSVRPGIPEDAAPAEAVREAGRDSDGSDALWVIAAAVWRRRWWIAAFTVVAAGAAVAFALSLPNYYRSEARVMLPASGGGSSMSSLVESVAPGASALLGAGGGGDYTRYLAILTSRTVAERAVERFNLVDVYQTGDRPSPVAAAIDKFHQNTAFDVSLEYNFMAIGVRDLSPRRAAAMANYLVEELNTENTRLSSESANERRVFIETRLGEAEAALDSVRGEIQAFQERSGITEPGIQGEALMSAITTASAAVAQADIYYQSLVSAYGDSGDNPDVAAARAALGAARAQLDRLTSGGSALMPVPLSELPQVGRQYAQLQQEQLIQAQIIEFVRPLYEQATFSERQVTSAVQIIDNAVVPVKKSDPKRSTIVLGITLSALVLAIAFVGGRALLRITAPRAASRMARAEAALAKR